MPLIGIKKASPGFYTQDESLTDNKTLWELVIDDFYRPKHEPFALSEGIKWKCVHKNVYFSRCPQVKNKSTPSDIHKWLYCIKGVLQWPKSLFGN